MNKLTISLVAAAFLAAPILSSCHRSGGSSIISPDPEVNQPPPDDTNLNNPTLGPGPGTPTTGGGSGGGTGGGGTGGGGTGGGGTGGGGGNGGEEPSSPAVPEPGTIAVVGIGLAAAHLASRKKRRK